MRCATPPSLRLGFICAKRAQETGGVPPRAAGLATIHEKHAPRCPRRQLAGSVASPAAARGPAVQWTAARRQLQGGLHRRPAVNLTTARQALRLYSRSIWRSRPAARAPRWRRLGVVAWGRLAHPSAGGPPAWRPQLAGGLRTAVPWPPRPGPRRSRSACCRAVTWARWGAGTHRTCGRRLAALRPAAPLQRRGRG